MISCTTRYEIDPDTRPEFETCERVWLADIPVKGGTRHGYHMLRERETAAYLHAHDHAERGKGIGRDDRNLTRSVRDGASADDLVL
ncbi:hypothetical protein [Jannaschia seohaensis]|uniref:Uncharacterized protein n=1 Tax=Jannaschia seohaensis TaxID=475081 RepID=A0A2Y9B2M2_9RHOB|nr:hypothetical protein [Jannaschia seohaensis]PWJ16192.1 hypothetical protein BCF38_10976 [Jannaschia seohaensis]SSA49207.1 hypothetical protein SAMN05421539_10976 [Jannaschia seohaensis]